MNWNAVLLGNLPKDSKKTARIYMMNHQSFADPFVVTIIGRKIGLGCIYKDAVNKFPLAAIVFPICGNVPIKFTYDNKRDIKIPDSQSVKYVMQVCSIHNVEQPTANSNARISWTME